jgi:multidrug efflux pump
MSRSARPASKRRESTLGYTSVVSPITGRIGSSLVTQGAYVQASAATLLTTVQQIDPIYVDLNQSSIQGLQLRRDVASGKVKLNGPAQATVTLFMEDGSQYPLPGSLQFTDITVDQNTGSVTVRAIFPNPRHVLLPGMFVRARIEEGIDENALLVPHAGVSHNPQGQATALVVGPDGKVALRTIQATRTLGDNWVVDGGLSAGDRVVVSGVQKVQPGSTVRVVDAPAPAAPGQQKSAAADTAPVPASPHTPPGVIPRHPVERGLHGQVLHRPADLRDRPRDPDHAGRDTVDCVDAGRAVSVRRSAFDSNHDELPRRLRGDGGEHGRPGDRAADERARPSDLSVLHQRRLRTGRHYAHVRRGNQPRHCASQVQNKLQLATPLLPQAVQQSGIKVTKSSSSFLLAIGFVSTDNSMSRYDIANYVVSNIQDPVSRINGVGNLNVFGTQYAMRIWLDPNKLNNYALTPVDVTAALQNQNVQVASGQLGGTPAPVTQQLSATITEASLLRTPEAVRQHPAESAHGRLAGAHPGRRAGRARRRELQRRQQIQRPARVRHRRTAGDGSERPRDERGGTRTDRSDGAVLSAGLKAVYPYETAPFVKASMIEVVKTLFEGIVLVFLVMYLFLQNIRATLIPTVAVPVVLLGTFGVMAAASFTINTLSMFGLVLAIGLLVDDAIVVVENVERVMREEGLPPVEATRKAMGQISGALVGVAMVLSAVFVPMAFSAGSVGAIYRQFSLTIVSAMLLSVFVALSLTPALCATILKAGVNEHGGRKGFFGWFNRYFEAGRDHYVQGVRHVIARFGRWLLVYAAVIAAVGLLFVRLPTAFLPDEDQGSMFVQVQTPPGATQSRTAAVLEDISQYLLKDEAAMVESTFQINGFNFAGRGQSQGFLFVRFRDFNVRQSPDLKVQALMGRISRHFASYKDAVIIPINPPPIRELGTASGFDLELQDRGGVGHDGLAQARNQLISLAQKDPTLALVRPNGLADNPTFKINIDREKASALGVNVSDIDQTFSIAWASRYINNFLDTDGRIKKVYVQSDAPYRMNPEDMNLLYVRNSRGTMVPFTSFATGTWTYGSPKLERYNGISAMEIQGQAAQGKSTGQAILAMERLAQKLPAGIGYEWTGISLQQLQAGSQAPLLYALSVLVVFLSLAALYESWSIPVSVIMVVPVGVLGALGAATAFGMSDDVYFQVGLLTTVGLSSKNAILIVEFARELAAQGRTALEAAVEAAHIRMRPIVMTSLAFGLGVLPLAIANGPGSASQNAIGRGVLGGMLAATFLATFMIPMFYFLVAEKLRRRPKAAPPAPAQPAIELSGSHS